LSATRLAIYSETSSDQEVVVPSEYHRPSKRFRRPKKQHTCRGKVRYRNQELANQALRGIAEFSERTKQAKRAYFCGGCNGWHLTSKPEYSSNDEVEAA
jgi:hypothetical protein